MSGTMAEIMDGLAALVPTDNAYAWPVESVTVPCFVVGYPSNVDFDLTFGRGGDTFRLPVWQVVGKSGSKAARDLLSAALTGVASVKEALDGAQTFGDVRVTDASIEEITIAAVAYVGIKFNVEVI